MKRTPVYAGLVQEAIRAHIDACGSRVGSVLFVKKDGTLRRLNFNARGGLNDLADTERGNRAAETRRQNHPNLKPIFDMQKRAWRSINLDTVLTVKSAGKVTRYRDVQRIAPGIYELVPVVSLQIGVVES